MKRTPIFILLLLPFLVQGQPKSKTKRYPSLLWEISGNGLARPSYLFGTMHVSSKLAFHLADSFYLGIRNADVVALETNPESWQEDMSRYDVNDGYDGYNSSYRAAGFTPVPEDYLSINTLKFYKYDKKIERALYSNPSAINNLLYRSYGNETSDFEEDTYLDMYIYQCGKKWGKKVAGVERYEESMKLMMEAYKDAAKDRNTKDRSYDNEEGYSYNKLQEAYRSGNLDWLDSINKYNSFSAAFDEKFLYRRNEIQATSIDSILRSGQSLFVGVGAAHLPGNRGVIEMLRQQGYTLRPVRMGARDSHHKEQVEKVRVAVSFSTQSADDGLFKVDIPGKFYKFGDDINLDQRQYADMANGSYYMVTRIMTNAWMWGHSTEKVNKVIDSLLYENVPGKIISKTSITRNGYSGLDIINKTRRGDIQRYNIFVTPFEVIIFKMSGTGEYVKNGDEAKKFFGSIQFKEYKPTAELSSAGWLNYSPSYGGFNVKLPHQPHIGNDGSWLYDAEDKANNTQYRIIRTDIHNYHFAEEDTFDLALMSESFAASEFIDKQVSRKQTTFKGYPALDCQYRDKSGGIYLAKFIIRGPHYYTLVAHGAKETNEMKEFLNSFEIKPFVYASATGRVDSNLYYCVKSPVFPEAQKEKLNVPRYAYNGAADDDDLTEKEKLEEGVFRSKVISNDSTGEKIFVTFFKLQPYYQIKDSTVMDKENQGTFFGDSTVIVKWKKEYQLPDKMKVWESVITDTGSSRTLWTKTFFKDGIGFALLTQSDTLSKPSSFVQSFYDSFAPCDTLAGHNPFEKKANLFFSDFASTDSVAHNRAIKEIYNIKLDSGDLKDLQAAVSYLSWKEKKYLDTKKALIGKLEDIKTRHASDYLKELFYAAGDTLELQYKILETLLQQETQYAYNTFKEIMINEPPVLDIDEPASSPGYSSSTNSRRRYDYENDGFMDDLYDSLKLTKTILPDILPLINIDDYRNGVMQLLAVMVDSNLLDKKTYEIYLSKFLIEAKQELKKQAITEKQKAIVKAEMKKEDNKGSATVSGTDEDRGSGNEKLRLYATLMLPFWDANTNVQPLFRQMLSSSDKRLKYNILLLLIRNTKTYPDSLLNYFARLDEYRYELYSDLKGLNKLSIFPRQYNNHLDLAKSKIFAERTYDKPDSLVFADKVPADVNGKKGLIYFFKYKTKKDDATWKLASVGLVPADPKEFEFDDIKKEQNNRYFDYNNYSNSSRYDFTSYSNTKIKVNEPLGMQLNKELKRMLYSKRRSAKEFYDKARSESFEPVGDESYEEDSTVSTN